MVSYKTFEDKIKPILIYTGMIGAILAGIMYLVVTITLVLGFQAKTFTQAIVFAVVGAVLGLIIFFFLRFQGISFAKINPENEKVLKEYCQKTPKTKYHSLKYFWIRSTITDIITKGLTVALSTAGVIYIVIEGSEDFKLILLAFANLILFTCFGLIAMSNAYDYYNDQYVPFMKEEIEARKQALETLSSSVKEDINNDTKVSQNSNMEP